MPRDANGLYTLPLPAVASGTTITSLWGNTTTQDIAAALSDSLSRSAQGGMLAPLRLVDGSAASPALSFASQVGLGFYRSAAGVVNFATSGVTYVRFNAANQLEVFRDEGSGAQWWPVSTTAGGEFFNYLQGYAQGGLHIEYAGDLDLILVNSKFYIDFAAVTNGPADFIGLGVVETDMWDIDADQAVQLLVSMDIANNGASWIRAREGGVWQAWKPFGAGGTTVSDTPPTSPSVGDGWWDSNTGNAYVYYDDGDSQQWVQEDPIGDPAEYLPGMVVQDISIETATILSTTAIVPFDDSPPQITEGLAIFASPLVITPKYIGSRIRVQLKLGVVSIAEINGAFITWITRDGEADAIATTTVGVNNASLMGGGGILEFEMVAPSLTPISFNARFGANTASGALVNQTFGGGRKFGGTSTCHLTITEIRQ
jgi:hypothetical protein